MLAILFYLDRYFTPIGEFCDSNFVAFVACWAKYFLVRTEQPVLQIGAVEVILLTTLVAIYCGADQRALLAHARIAVEELLHAKLALLAVFIPQHTIHVHPSGPVHVQEAPRDCSVAALLAKLALLVVQWAVHRQVWPDGKGLVAHSSRRLRLDGDARHLGQLLAALNFRELFGVKLLDFFDDGLDLLLVGVDQPELIRDLLVGKALAQAFNVGFQRLQGEAAAPFGYEDVFLCQDLLRFKNVSTDLLFQGPDHRDVHWEVEQLVSAQLPGVLDVACLLIVAENV